MEFLKKAELFFIQLQYCLTIEPEPVLQAEKGMYSLSLEPDVFLKLINDFHIEYPFIHINKIIELKALMNKESININDALKVIEAYKKQYWFLDSVIMFEPVTEKLKRTLKKNDTYISEKDINNELINYQKYLQEKRESFYIQLINEIQCLPTQQTGTKADKLKAQLSEYGFFELPKVKQLSETKKQSLIEFICSNNLPYTIAMLDFLGFLKHLKTEHFTTDYKLFQAVAIWFEVSARTIKGNVYVLNEKSSEDRTRYTADQQKKKVQKDYEELK